MSSSIIGTATYECNKCGTRVTIDSSAFELVSSEPRNMGAENHYMNNWETTCSNPKCNNDIELEFSIYEYSEGVENDRDESATGATIVSNNFSLQCE